MLRPLSLLGCILVLVFSFSPTGAETPATHTVAWGETLYSVARAYGVTPQAIANANGITVNSWVYAGERLIIPVNSSTPSSAMTPSGYYAVRAGDTLFSIGSRFGVSTAAIAAANNLPADGVIYVGWSLKIPFGAPNTTGPRPVAAETYIVQSGEYLAQIALRYGTTIQAIALANNLPNDWLIYAGQRLTIPGVQILSPAPSVAAVAGTEIRVPNVPLYQQQQTLTCEEASVAMATRGVVAEARLVAAIPRSDNPFNGIRGRTNSPYFGGLTDYGVYAQAVQKGLNTFGVRSEVLYGQKYEDFKDSILSHLRAGHPIVWWHTWHETFQNPVLVRTSDGALAKLVPYEHAGVIIGANDRGITYHDPYDATVRYVTWADHRRVSTYFDNMALVIK
ncbi:MAG TPA: LysM peptidoglycan-binding domain-containing protein [Anaerolineae bacterium]